MKSSPAQHAVVWLHTDAPPKPVEGAPCNGCGLCCLAEPCPLGMVVSRRRQGACVALRWDDTRARYLCGMVVDPGSVLSVRHCWLIAPLAWLARRWIDVGAGCDADLTCPPSTVSR